MVSLFLPSVKDITELPKIEKFEKITNVFNMEQMHWSRLMEVKNVAELNDTIVAERVNL